MRTDSCIEAKELHNCLLMLADEIHRICSKNEIPYFLIAGSLLGAVRHKGFIPWDDDLDIGMLRSDYDKFIKICDKELGVGFSVSNVNTEKHFGVPFCKIRLKGTRLPESGTPKDLDNGIFVDVIPIDVMPQSKLSQKMQHLFTNCFKYVLLFNCGYDMSSTKQHPLIVVIAKLLAQLPKAVIVDQLLYWQTKYNRKKGQCFINLCSSYPYGKEVFPFEALKPKGTLPLIDFEGRKYHIPCMHDEILTNLYGDYMTLPPIENRVFRHAEGDIYFGCKE